MKFAAALLLAIALRAERPRVVLIEEIVRVDAAHSKTIGQIPLRQRKATLELKFDVKNATEGVKLRLSEEDSGEVVFETPYRNSGDFRIPLHKAGNYKLVVENHRQRLGAALVDCEVAMVFDDAAAAPSITELDPKRRFFTIAISIALFSMIVSYAAVRLAPILQRRSWQPPDEFD